MPYQSYRAENYLDYLEYMMDTDMVFRVFDKDDKYTLNGITVKRKWKKEDIIKGLKKEKIISKSSKLASFRIIKKNNQLLVKNSKSELIVILREIEPTIMITREGDIPCLIHYAKAIKVLEDQAIKIPNIKETIIQACEMFGTPIPDHVKHYR